MDATATIRGVVPFEVNDEPYFTIYFVHDSDPEDLLEARLPRDAIYPHPHVNDHVRVHYVFQVPTRIEHLDK